MQERYAFDFTPNGQEPAPAEQGDWIPEYPPQEGDDNQNSSEYPEYPSDEQRD